MKARMTQELIRSMNTGLERLRSNLLICGLPAGSLRLYVEKQANRNRASATYLIRTISNEEALVVFGKAVAFSTPPHCCQHPPYASSNWVEEAIAFGNAKCRKSRTAFCLFLWPWWTFGPKAFDLCFFFLVWSKPSDIT